MKEYIVENQLFNCPNCKTNYAAGKSSTKILAQITPELITSWVAKFFAYFVFVLLVVIYMIFAGSFNNRTDLVGVWKAVLYVFFGISLGLSVIYVTCFVRNTIKRLRRSDIEIFCYQTEIGYHSQNPREILKEYFENAGHASFIQDLKSERSFEKKLDTESTPFKKSSRHENKPKQNKKTEEDDEPLSKILNFGESETPIRNPIKFRSESKASMKPIPQTPQVDQLGKYIVTEEEEKKTSDIGPNLHKLDELSSIRKLKDIKIESNLSLPGDKKGMNATKVDSLYQVQNETGKRNESKPRSEDPVTPVNMGGLEQNKQNQNIILEFSYELNNELAQQGQTVKGNKEETLSLDLTIQDDHI
mgnify:CR=1 FL=1